MRFDEETNTAHKCIHEALDYTWCDCSDETRKELHVTLPKPEDNICDSCEEGQATCTLVMTDSLSMDNLSFACDECAYHVITDWFEGSEVYSDIEGWEIRKL